MKRWLVDVRIEGTQARVPVSVLADSKPEAKRLALLEVTGRLRVLSCTEDD